MNLFHQPHLLRSGADRTTSRKGSVLLVSLIFAGIIAIALGGFLTLATQSAQYSYRTFYVGAAMNAAETGLEQAMWAVNKRVADKTFNWTNNGWKTDGTAATQTLTLDNSSAGAKTQVKVYVSNYALTGGKVFALSRSIITPKKGSPVERWIRIDLKRRAPFSNGLVAKDNISFVGNGVSVDSYDSRLGVYDAAISGGNNKFARGTAGSSNINADAVSIQNANIWGSVVVGYDDIKLLQAKVGSNGIVGPFGTASGTVVLENVQTNFTANFDDVAHPDVYTGTGAYTISTAPANLPRPPVVTSASAVNTVTSTAATGIIGTVTTPGSVSTTTTATQEVVATPVTTTTVELVPAVVSKKGVITAAAYYKTTQTTTTTTVTTVFGDAPASDGKYYYNLTDINSSVAIDASREVIIRMVPSTGTSIDIKGTDAITLGTGAKLTIYTQGDVAIAGNGLVNPGKPENFFLYGTRPQSDSTAQDLKIAGNGNLSAVVYAPNASITMNGGGTNGNIFGAIIGETISVTGGSYFHYDEALADYNADSSFSFTGWTEFVSAEERNKYKSYVSF